MKVLVVGAGPAGLYFSYLLKRQDPGCEIRAVEQTPGDATFGFGVVFSDRALEFLRADDPTTYELITPELEAWVDLVVVHRGERNVIDGIGFNAIGRLHFLRFMQQQAASVGVQPEFNTPVGDIGGHDPVVAADGANSTARRSADFSIGSGTRLAMEDAIALVKALGEQANINNALKNFEAARRPIVEKLVAAADASGAWYDQFPEHMKLSPRDFAWSYIQRSGRVDPERLSRISPRFART